MKNQIDFDRNLAEVYDWLFSNTHAASAEMKEKLRGLWWAYYEARERGDTLNAVLVSAAAKGLLGLSAPATRAVHGAQELSSAPAAWQKT